MPPHDSDQNQLVIAFDEGLIRSLRRLGLQDSALLVAVSGGADSTALLLSLTRIATRMSLRLEVATVDHGLRSASGADVDFVLSETDRLGLKGHAIRLRLAGGAGVEARAREARYAELHVLRLKLGLGWLVTAHTASDQAETLMMRLMRGTSLAGSASIHAARADSVARPLLFATRAEVEASLQAVGASWRHDPMNDDPHFQRVKVRQSLMPVIEELSHGATRALARFAAMSAEDEVHLQTESRAALARLRSADGALDRVGVCALTPPIARRVMAAFLSEHAVALDADLISDTLAAAAAMRDATLPNDRVLSCGGGRLEVLQAPPRHIHGTSRSVHGRGENS